MIASAVYVFCAIFYVMFGSGVRQAFDNPANDVVHYHTKNQNDSNETNRMLGRNGT